MPLLGPTNPPRLPVGASDYAQARLSGVTLVDKTGWIGRVLDQPGVVQLFTRPRRFGKTLNISALRAFLDDGPDLEVRRPLFEDALIWELDGGRFRKYFGRHPAIYLSLKDVKAATWPSLWMALSELLMEALERALKSCENASFQLGEADLNWLSRVRAARAPEDLGAFLRKASAWLHTATGKRVAILIDEYDTPIHSAWEGGYGAEAIAFFRTFLSAGLKDNPALFKGVLTGILRVAREGLFSGLNHLEVHTVLSDDMADDMADDFGFTEAEVAELAEARGVPELLPVVKHWYDGYRFGLTERATLYNPWSVVNFLKATHPVAQAFWVNTSDNALVGRLLRRHALALGPGLATLFDGGSIPVTLDGSAQLEALAASPDAVLGLLAFAGYLTAEQVSVDPDGLLQCALRLPNHEVRTVFKRTFGHWLAEGQSHPGGASAHALSDAILSGDATAFEAHLGALLLALMSHHDVAGDPVEAVYQAFFLGLLADLGSTHRVLSNREAGHGRADLLIAPRVPAGVAPVGSSPVRTARHGAVLELKRVRPRASLRGALAEATAQLASRDYAAELRASGATAIFQYAVAFDGKRCAVVLVPPREP